MTVKKSIDKLYSVFSLYEPPAKIKHFNCNHCVSDKDEDFLLNTPLKELDDNIFGLYFEACNVGKFPSSNHKYFIPRLLELLALEEPNKNFSFLEYFFACFSFYDYQNTFEKNEIITINDFFEAYLDRDFFAENADQDSHSIIFSSQAGFDVIPFLEKLKLQSEIFKDAKKEIELYFGYKKENSNSVHYSNFEEWAKMGEMHKLILYLSEN